MSRNKKNKFRDRYTEDFEGSSRVVTFQKSSKAGLSKATRDKVLGLRKIKDPFDPELQGAFDEFMHHVEHVATEDVDLSEVGLLLAGVSKIYTSQVDSLVQDVQDLLSFVTNTKKASLERKKNKEDESALEGSQEGTMDTTVDSVPEADGISKPDEDTVSPNPETVSSSEEVLVGEEISTNNTDVPQNTFETITIEDNDTNDGFPVPEESLNVPESTTSDLRTTEVNPDPETNPNQAENSDPNSQGPLLDQVDENGPETKKPKNGIKTPPTLISCFEELENLTRAGFFDRINEDGLLAPLLGKAFRISKRKLHFDEKEKKDEVPVKKMKEKLPLTDTVPMESATSVELDAPNLISLNPTQAPQSEEIDIKPTLAPDGSVIGYQLPSQAVPVVPGSFSTEDQAAIQECINELHYLPFTFGLSKTDLGAAFSRTVERMSQIFKKNNVQVSRNMVKEATVMASQSLNSTKTHDGSVNGIIHPVVHNLGDIYSSFVKSCREECETFLTNSTAILERTKEKSFAESRANIRAMIAELQRNIVPKFARVPLMAENTPEFFQHVTNFEKKMKKILEEEAKKDEFDVRKYEREVLDVTAKESSELDISRLSDDFLIPLPPSPMKPQSVDGDTPEPIFASASTRSSFDGSQSSCGGSWVPLKHIFQHMKSIDRTEAARSFYAVLALLSYQNLDINYDQLYSVESAALIRKQLSAGNKEDELDSKFPRGSKIITSRCPDVDKEEVFIAALTSESRDEAFRQLLAQEAKNIAMRDRAPGTSHVDLVNGHDESLAEAMADFVEESGSVFAGKLLGKRRRKTDI